MKNTKALSPVVGILFVLSAISPIKTLIYGLLNHYPLIQNLVYLAFAIGPVLLALSMFLQNVKLSLLGASIQAIGNILCIKRIFDIYRNHMRIANLLFTLLDIFAWCLIVYAIIKKSNQKTYCTISAGLILATFLIRQIYWVAFWGASFGFAGLLRQLPTIISVALTGAVIEDTDFISGASKSIQKTAPVKLGVESQIDKLTKLKGLLDSGVITQEEFDEKKKELLNL